MKKIFNIGTLALCIGLFMASCGNSEQNKSNEVDHSNHGTEATTSSPTAAESKPSAAVSNDITVESNDQMQFNIHEIKVKAGEPASITLKHVGKMAKEVMGHNIVILKPGTDIVKFSEAALQAKDKEYIPASTDVIAHSKLIGGGEESKFDFTLEPGTYDFICSFPGHAGIMKGKIIAE